MNAVIDPSVPSVVGVVPEGVYLSGPWSGFITLPVPEGTDTETLGVMKEGDEYVFCVDPSKVEAKTAQAWRDLRARRNQLLQQSDWTALADAHLSQAKKDAWFAYRQELRDLPDSVTDPTQVEWPTLVLEAPVTGSRVDNLLSQV